MAPLEFVAVPRQVLDLDVVANSVDPPLEQCPVAFQPVGMGHASEKVEIVAVVVDFGSGSWASSLPFRQYCGMLAWASLKANGTKRCSYSNRQQSLGEVRGFSAFMTTRLYPPFLDSGIQNIQQMGPTYRHYFPLAGLILPEAVLKPAPRKTGRSR